MVEGLEGGEELFPAEGVCDGFQGELGGGWKGDLGQRDEGLRGLCTLPEIGQIAQNAVIPRDLRGGPLCIFFGAENR